MIFIVDEDIVLRHIHFQLDKKIEAKIMPSPDNLGIDLICDDEDISFIITFTPTYIGLLRELIDKLGKFSEDRERESS